MTKRDSTRSNEAARRDKFTDRVKTRICEERAAEVNPYLAEQVLWHGYDVTELVTHRDLVDVVFLLLCGELPRPGEKKLLEQLLISLANPGPRHVATRSVMSAGVFRTRAHQILPIGLSMMSGEHMGSGEVEAAMRFLAKNHSNEARKVATALREMEPDKDLAAGKIAPGFGTRFGGIDPFAASISELLLEQNPDCSVLRWGQGFVAELAQDKAGWLMPGLAAAVFVELGFRPVVGACLYQLAAAPGLIAHGVEMHNKPVTALPFVPDEKYLQVESCDV